MIGSALHTAVAFFATQKVSLGMDDPTKQGEPSEARSRTRRPYHHGNLKDALVEAARTLIEQHGPEGFSLTEAARRVGVTPAAPYRHFTDREALMAEVSRRGFALFQERQRAAWDEGQPNPLTALSRMGRSYLDFARTEPGYYRSMFTRAQQLGPSGPMPAGATPEPPPSLAAFSLLIEAASAVLHARWPGRQIDPFPIALEIWALSHGTATLMLGGYLPATGAADPYSLLDKGALAFIENA